LDVQDERGALLLRRGSAPALCLSGAASLARADSTFGTQALLQLDAQGATAAHSMWSRMSAQRKLSWSLLWSALTVCREQAEQLQRLLPPPAQHTQSIRAPARMGTQVWRLMQS